ncbi:MAG: hypothetical protein WCV92_05385, partial [Candidatus Buchananbacteria bacterium]
MKYFFILGKTPVLSIAEITSLFARDQVEFELVECSAEVLIVETKKELDADYLMAQLGGTVKLGIVHANKYANTNELNANTIVGEFLGDA